MPAFSSASIGGDESSLLIMTCWRQLAELPLLFHAEHFFPLYTQHGKGKKQHFERLFYRVDTGAPWTGTLFVHELPVLHVHWLGSTLSYEFLHYAKIFHVVTRAPKMFYP